MNRDEFNSRISVQIKERDVFTTEIIQEFKVDSHGIVREIYRREYTEVLEYMKKEGKHAIADILYGDVKQKLRKFRSHYAKSPTGFSYDLIDELNEIIDSMPD